MKTITILVLGCAFASAGVTLGQVSSLPGGTPTSGGTPSVPAPSKKPTPVRVIKRKPVKVVVPPTVQKKPNLKGIESKQAVRFQSLKGTDLKDRPNFKPGQGDGKNSPSLSEKQLRQLGVGGMRLEANSDVARVKPRGGQTATFDLSKSLSSSSLQDLLMSDAVKDGVGRSIREDIGKAKDFGVNFKERGSVLGGAVGRVGGKTLEPNGGAVGGIGKYRKGMGLNRGRTGRVENRRSRYGKGFKYTYTDIDGVLHEFYVLPEGEDDNKNFSGGATIHVPGELLEAAKEGSEEAWIEIDHIMHGVIAREKAVVAQTDTRVALAEAEDEANKDEDDDGDASNRGAGGLDQENDKGGPGNLDGQRFGGGFAGSGGGGTVRMGGSSGQGGPLEKAPKSGNSGYPTIRMDQEDVGKGILNLGRIDKILEGKNGPIDFGEKGDPRDQPEPQAGGEGPTIPGGAPGVVTKNLSAKALGLKAGSLKLGDSKGESTKVDVKKVEVKEGAQLKAK